MSHLLCLIGLHDWSRPCVHHYSSWSGIQPCWTRSCECKVVQMLRDGKWRRE